MTLRIGHHVTVGVELPSTDVEVLVGSGIPCVNDAAIGLTDVVNAHTVAKVFEIYIQLGVSALAANAYAGRRRAHVHAIVGNQAIAVALADEELGPGAFKVVGIGNEYARGGIAPIRNIKLTLAVDAHAVVAAPYAVTVVNLVAHANTVHVIQINTVALVVIGNTVAGIDGTHPGTAR